MNETDLSPDEDEVPLAEVIQAPASAPQVFVSSNDSPFDSVVLLEADFGGSSPFLAQRPLGAPQGANIRRGSPFAVAIRRVVQTPRELRHAARGAAQGSCFIGLWSLVAVFLVASPLVRLAIFFAAMLGVALGIWGLSSLYLRTAGIGVGTSIGAAAVSVLLTLLLR